MLSRSRAVTICSFRSSRCCAPLRSALPPQNPLVSTAYRNRSLSYFRWPSRQPPPTYSRFPPNRSRPSPDDGQLPPPIFNHSPRLAELWRTDPHFRTGVRVIAIGGSITIAGVIFYALNLERVPVSGRVRFNCISDKWEAKMGAWLSQALMRQYGERLLPSQHPSCQMTERVMERLIAVSGAAGEGPWEAVVIDDPERVNAFVVPG